MAKKPERKQKLKVFRTPIGFHDAYVAAPSQKAALEAWGADSNLFTQGIAEQVTDEKLMEDPLANPGQVVRRLRGSQDDHVAALDASEKSKKPKKSAAKERPKATKPPKPSRAELDAAEEAVEAAEKKHRKELRAIDQEIQTLERRRRELQRSHEVERDKLAEASDRALSAYKRAMRAWDSS